MADNYYKPAFFRMGVEHFYDLDLNNASEGIKSLYLHEYIHFLQDISTVYGLMNMSMVNHYVRYAASSIIKIKKKEFTVPITLKKTQSKDFGIFNAQLAPIYFGSHNNPNIKKMVLSGFKINHKGFIGPKNKRKFVPAIEIVFEDSFKNTVRKEFGGNLVCEGMAYLIERYVYSDILDNLGTANREPAADYPYLVCEQLASFIYPSIENRDLLIIAICDCSLQTYNPGYSFVKIVKFLKRRDFLLENSTLTEEELIAKLYLITYELLSINYHNIYVLKEDVKKNWSKYFGATNFAGNNIWFETILDRAYKLRMQNSSFITKFVAEKKTLNESNLFLSVHNELGSPLVLNGENGSMISIPEGFDDSNFRPYLLFAIDQVRKVFSNNNPIPCGLKEYCTRSREMDNKIEIDDRCDNEPWKRVNDKDLCPFAVMWKHWSLSGFKPNFEEKRQ